MGTFVKNMDYLGYLAYNRRNLHYLNILRKWPLNNIIIKNNKQIKRINFFFLQMRQALFYNGVLKDRKVQ